jgi:hypothetical protein
MIIIGSRYESADIVPVRTNGRSTATVTVLRRPPDEDAAPPTQYLDWTDGDRLDLLSDRKFGTPREWWRVLDVNDSLLNPLDIRPGVKVFLP